MSILVTTEYMLFGISESQIASGTDIECWHLMIELELFHIKYYTTTNSVILSAVQSEILAF